VVNVIVCADGRGGRARLTTEGAASPSDAPVLRVEAGELCVDFRPWDFLPVLAVQVRDDGRFGGARLAVMLMLEVDDVVADFGPVGFSLSGDMVPKHSADVVKMRASQLVAAWAGDGACNPDDLWAAKLFLHRWPGDTPRLA